jgi:hypothetical protein
VSEAVREELDDLAVLDDRDVLGDRDVLDHLAVLDDREVLRELQAEWEEMDELGGELGDAC